MDVLVFATWVFPAAVGLAAGRYGWGAGLASAVAITLAISAGFLLYGALHSTACSDCTRYAVLHPLAWVFVLMISGGWIVATASAAAGFAAGRWSRDASVSP